MQVHTFIVDSAAEAVGLIRAKLGPQAVVLSVRRLPADGISKLWKKPRIEVLATVQGGPDPESPSQPPVSRVPPVEDPLLELRREMLEIRAEVQRSRVAAPHPQPATPPAPSRDEVPLTVESYVTKGVAYPGTWRVGPILEATGLLPMYALRIVERLCHEHGEGAPGSLGEELILAAKALQGEWTVPQSPPQGGEDIHIFIGPPGSGKTTALCKWLAQAVLVEGRPATVWRLDGLTANTAESLSVYAEILGVPVERFMPESGAVPPGLLFIDLPGVSAGDVAALDELRARIARFGPAQVHLVLNAAYESAVLLAQVRAFGSMGVMDLIATHLDEEPRWGKLWNWVIGTNCPLGWLSVGQNIPGEFRRADPGYVLNRQFSRKT